MRSGELKWFDRRIFPYGLLPLYSVFVTSNSDGKWTATQIRAKSPRAAFEKLLGDRWKRIRKLLSEAAPEALSPVDVILFVEMDGLTNMWLGQAGRKGKYIDVVLAETAPGKKGI